MTVLEMSFFVWSVACFAIGILAVYEDTVSPGKWTTGMCFPMVALASVTLGAISGGNWQFFLGLVAYFFGLIFMIIVSPRPAVHSR